MVTSVSTSWRSRSGSTERGTSGRVDGSLTNWEPWLGQTHGVPIRVFLLDDHEVVRRGLRDLLDAEDDIEVVGEAGSVSDVLARVAVSHPQVAVLDVRLPDGSGIEACRDIRSAHPEVACLMLTSYADDEALHAAMLAGSSGYVLKDVRDTELVAGIRRVAEGQSLFDRASVARALARLRQPQEDELSILSPQERTLLDHISEGLTNRQIANEMHLAEKTVKNYVSNLLAKLGMHRRTEAAVYAARLAERRRHPPPSGDAPPT